MSASPQDIRLLGVMKISGKNADKAVKEQEMHREESEDEACQS